MKITYDGREWEQWEMDNLIDEIEFSTQVIIICNCGVDVMIPITVFGEEHLNCGCGEGKWDALADSLELVELCYHQLCRLWGSDKVEEIKEQFPSGINFKLEDNICI